ncbi:MAG TPA: GNAT family N-acetyltransferase [Mycobacteriales bacterium]|nr:GNAT family N-acetyltransferase [Mycobacteriales bacterium]
MTAARRRPAMTGYEYQPLTADQLRGLPLSLHRLYRRCRAGPPWLETDEEHAAYPARLADHLDQPGTHGIVATDAVELVGVVYGWPVSATQPGSPFEKVVYAAVPPGLRHILAAPAVRVVELMVDPAHQGRGIGRSLLIQLTAGCPAAWLCTHPDSPARHLYESAGWRRLARLTSSAGTPLLVYGCLPPPGRDR